MNRMPMHSDRDDVVQTHVFKTTQWSLVLGLQKGEEARSKGLEDLCKRYWYPVYFFIRNKSHEHADAQDLTQSFFSEMLTRDGFQQADSSKGKFRTYLLTCLTRHLQQDWRKEQAQKRNPGERILSLDFESGAERYESVAQDSILDPDKAWDRQWAQSVIRHVIRRLEKEYRDSGKGEEFETFKPLLTSDKGEVTYKQVAEKLNIGVNTARTAIYRFRQKYARLFREEIAQTLHDGEDVESEIKALLSSLSA